MSRDLVNLFAGRFIVFDGIDGSGKDAVKERIALRLEEAGVIVSRLVDPGSTTICEAIRSLLLRERSDEDLHPNAELALYMAARAQLLYNRILPSLADNICILCARWVFSTFAYQGGGRGHPYEVLEKLHEYFCGNIMPHVLGCGDGLRL